jgi:hypothetical protein
MTTATRQVAEGVRAQPWVEAYKRSNAEAARWASGSGRVRHTVETQERVFRMAEQVRHRPGFPSGELVFTVLQALDYLAKRDTDAPQPSASPALAAATGIVAYKTIFGQPVAVGAQGWPRDFEVAEEEEAELVIYGLRAGGFDPIVFDGRDPAAYTWALFEIRERKAADREAARAYQRACPRPCALAIVPTPPVRWSQPSPKGSASVLEPAGVGG